MGSKIQFVSTNKDQTSPTAVVATYSIIVVTRWLVGENRLHISNLRKLKANFCYREKEGHFPYKNFLRALKRVPT